jgi:hypothetical protein
MDDIRHDTVVGGSSKEGVNGSGKKVNGADDEGKNGNKGGGRLAVPQAVLDDALKVTRESLETVCEIEGDGT